MKKILLIAIAVFVSLTACSKEDNNVPVVVSSTPANGEKEIDPNLETITVEFNEVMDQSNSSWSADEDESFPEVTEDAYFINDGRKNILPVKLESNKNYVLWLNKEGEKKFKDDSGNPLEPYKIEFSTGDNPQKEKDEVNLELST